MSITIKWLPFPGADVASYKLFRSMIGFRADVVPLPTLDTKTLQLKFQGGPLLTVTFNAVDPIIDQINAVIVGNGGKAFDSNLDGTKFIVRSTVREAPGSVEIVGGTALADLGLAVRTISEKSENDHIASIAALPDPEECVEFEDTDGAVEDYYAVSTIDGIGNESKLSPLKQAIEFTGDLCIVEGLIATGQGTRECDVEVRATLVLMPQTTANCAFISREPIDTLTDECGRFSFALLQGAHFQIDIPHIGYSRTICVPCEKYANLKEIEQDVSHQFPLGLSK